MFQVKFNRFLHPYEHAQRIFWYLVKRVDWTPSKIDIFWLSKSIFNVKTQLNLFENDFLFSICEQKNNFYQWHLIISFNFEALYLVKMCPIFDSSQSNRFTRYQKILWVCSFWGKNLLNFTWNTMKFHNRLLANVHYVEEFLIFWRNQKN